MKLYFSPGTCSRASHIVLEWIGKPYQTQQVSIHGTKSAELVDHNPMGAVPMLEEDGWFLTQNAAVLNYLADCFPDAGVGGDGTPRGRAEVNRWVGFVNSDMHPMFKPLFGASDYLGDATVIDKVKNNARETLAKRFALVDAHLAGREWLAGDRHSIADAYLYVMCTWAPKVVVEIGDLANITAFVDRMAADAAVKRVLADEAGT